MTSKLKSIGRDVSIPKDEHMEKEKGETFCFVTLRNKAGGKKQLFISKSGVEVIKWMLNIIEINL